MLSISVIKDSGAAGSYYTATDNYYAQDRAPSQWQGDGAKQLGLVGEVDPAESSGSGRYLLSRLILNSTDVN